MRSNGEVKIIDRGKQRESSASQRQTRFTRRSKVQPIRAPRVVQMPVRDWKMAAAGDYDDDDAA